MQLNAESSIVVVVDMQPTFLNGCVEHEQILNRSKFLVECAAKLEVPMVATVQYPDRMGGTEESLHALIQGETFPKMVFSCCGSEGFNAVMESTRSQQVILVGIETHICITQTALDLLEQGYEVYLAVDAISSRSAQSSKIGLQRLRDAGAWVCHTESVVYEWMKSAESPAFKEVLQIVKRYPVA